MQTLDPLEVVVTTQQEGTNPSPGQRWVEINFKDAPVSLHSIMFTNFYVSSITIQHSLTKAEGDPLLQVPAWFVAALRPCHVSCARDLVHRGAHVSPTCHLFGAFETVGLCT